MNGWKAENGGNVEVWNTGYQRVPARHGSNFIELDIYGDAALDGIYQDVKTWAGRRYRLTLYMRGRNSGIGTDDEKLTVEWNSKPLGVFQARRIGAWTHRVIVTDTGRVDRLKFREISSDGGRPLLDDVSLIEA